MQRWVEARAAEEKKTVAQVVREVAAELPSRGNRRHVSTSWVYALMNGTSAPSRRLAALIEKLSGGKVDAVKGW